MHPEIPSQFLASVSLSDERKSELLKALDDDPIISVRNHSRKSNGLSGREVPWCPQGKYLDQRPAFIEDPHFHAGAYYSQEASSMAIWSVLTQLSLPSNPAALDFCAAPGGKSTLLQDYFDGNGVVVSNEIHPKRNHILQENLVKWGYPNKIITQSDARAYSRMGACFDLVLVDAPCSGEGMFRKEMIAREEWSESNVEQCAIRQKDILKEITLTIKPGGYLIYSTCTFNPSENENIAHYLKEALEMKPVKINGDSLVDWDEIDDGRVIGWRAFPDKVEGEGLSVFVFKKEGAAHAQGSKKKKKVKKISLPKEIELEQNYYAIELKEKVVALNNSTHSMMGELIKNKLFIKSVGLQVGSHIKGKFIPDHEMVLSPFIETFFPKINLEYNDAIRYLRGEVFPIELKEKGWVNACYQGSQLGWLKSMGNRWNNYFPKYYRIRKDL